MSEAISHQISLFRSQIQNRRFNGVTLRILESILVAKDIRSLLEIRSAVRALLRSEITPVLGELSKKSANEKLFVVDFFVKAFALVRDTESCLALKYEALVLREMKHISDRGLHVSCEEWYTFAKDSFDNGFYMIAVKGFENALLRIQSFSNIDPDHDTFFVKRQVIDNIKKLRDLAVALVSSHSVHTESSNYLKRKAVPAERRCSSHLYIRQPAASIAFRSGIKTRNMKKLQQSQGLLLQNTSGF